VGEATEKPRHTGASPYLSLVTVLSLIFGGRRRRDNPKSPGSDGASPYPELRPTAKRCRCSASCWLERIIIRTMPEIKNASIPSMKTTLHEKLALIPPTPESPITLDGSLHPSQARSDGP
jgi:hypothetical protein